MNFNEWFSDPKAPHDYVTEDRILARTAWRAAMNSCAEMLEKEAEKSGKKAGEYSLFENKIELLSEQQALLNAAIKIREEIANS